MVDKESPIFPYDPYLDKIDYDRKFYEFSPTQPYFENYEQKFSDENLFEKYLSNEYSNEKQNVDDEFRFKDEEIITYTQKAYERPVNAKSDTQSKYKSKLAMTTVTTVQKPNVVNLNSTVSTKTVKTLDQILQNLINQEMLNYSN